MEQCYEYFRCNNNECPKKHNNTRNCWSIENTLCDVHFLGYASCVKKLGDKSAVCKVCLYYKYIMQESSS